MPFRWFYKMGKRNTPSPPVKPRIKIKKVEEDVMKFVTRAMLAATCAAFVLAPAASAAGLSDCIQLGKKTAEALAVAQTNDTTEAARAHAQAGRSYCASSQYAQGVARYTKALQLLGKV